MAQTTEVEVLPSLLRNSDVTNFPALSVEEINLLIECADLIEKNYCDYALMALWNAAVHNLKRKIEAFGVELWLSVVQEETGRKKYYKNGETLSERWEGVEDLILIKGAAGLGLLNKKAAKTL
jgi:hypothetical protein